jgi:hypothetical protein
MLRRLLFVSSVSAILAACVVPVGPEWSDPDSNYPPSIVSATPPVGFVLGGNRDGGSASLEVTVELADQNTQDDLYLRWIVDYPPYSADNTVLARTDIKPGGSSILRTPVIFAPDCNHVSHAIADHRLMLAVSDRSFSDADEQQPDAVGAGYLVEAVWPFVLSCQ